MLALVFTLLPARLCTTKANTPSMPAVDPPAPLLLEARQVFLTIEELCCQANILTPDPTQEGDRAVP